MTSALLGTCKGLIQPFACFTDCRIKWNGQWVQANPKLTVPALDRKAAGRKGDLLPIVLFSSPGTSPLFQPEPAGWLNDLGLALPWGREMDEMIPAVPLNSVTQRL